MTYLDDLERLSDLRDKGIISQKAFEEKKEAILSQVDGKTTKVNFKSTKTRVWLVICLGIFCILFMGGRIGYKEATNRHRANQILDYVSRCAVMAQTMGDGYTIGNFTKEWNEEKQIYENSLSNTNCQELMRMEEAPLHLYSGDFIVYAAQSKDKTFKIETPPIHSKEIRLLLLNRANSVVGIRKTHSNSMEFTFQK